MGSTVLGTEMTHFKFELSWTWLMESLSTIGPAFLLGCAICSVLAGLIGYFGLDWVWRWSVAKAWKKRNQRMFQVYRFYKNVKFLMQPFGLFIINRICF